MNICNIFSSVLHFQNCAIPCSKLRSLHSVTHGRNEIRWRPGQEASLAPPCSNQRSYGSRCRTAEPQPESEWSNRVCSSV